MEAKEFNETKMLQFAEDEIILKQGSTEKALYKIIRGKAIVYFNYGQEDEYMVGMLSEQRCFGELSILCGKPSIYTVVAYDDVLVMRIPEKDFDNFIRNNSANAIGIMHNLANTLLTLSFNINLILEELEQEKKIKPDTYKDITKKIRLYTALNAKDTTNFNTSI